MSETKDPMSALTEEQRARVIDAIDALAWERPDGVGLLSTRLFWPDYDRLRALLSRAACPVVCRGYLDGDENWHQLCIDKADRALAALEVGDA